MSEDIKEIDFYHGVTNTITGSEFYNTVAETCAQITNVLSDHCGPYATDALIIQDNTKDNLKDSHYAIFTKDGINIVKSIEFISPIQTHIRDLIAYIGGRVDSLSHDRTTTAMLFFTLLVEKYFRLFNNHENKDILSKKNLSKHILNTINEIEKEFEDSAVLTVDYLVEKFKITHKKAIRYVAHQQSMLSSKGDKELTNAIVEVVETLPKELYNVFTISQSGIETDKRFTVIYDDFDFVLQVSANVDDFNHELNTEYLAEECDILVSEDELIRGNPTLDIIFQYIQEIEIGNIKNDLVIIAKKIEGSFNGIINEFNKKNKFKIILFSMSIPNQYSSKITILSALLNVASVYPVAEHIVDSSLPYLIKKAKVHYKKNRRLYISNLYKKDGTQYHPSFNDPNRFVPYTIMVNTLRAVIEEYNSGRLRKETGSDYTRHQDYIEIYRRMISSDIRHVQLSGMRHDTMADRDVICDSLGAVMSSIDHGFVFDGYLKLFRILSGKKWENDPIATILKSVVKEILSYVHKQHVDKNNKNSLFEKNLKEALSFGGERLTELNIDINLPESELEKFRERISYYIQYPVDGEPTPYLNIDLHPGYNDIDVIQPADTFRELFKRINDLLPKLLNTNRVIIPGTANVGGTK